MKVAAKAVFAKVQAKKASSAMDTGTISYLINSILNIRRFAAGAGLASFVAQPPHRPVAQALHRRHKQNQHQHHGQHHFG